MARAVLGWSQSELAFRTGLTQRGIHKIEQGETEPRRATVRAVEAVWCDEGVEFEDLPDGGFRVNVRAALFDRPIVPQSRHRQAAPAPVGIASIAYLARRA